MRVVNRVFGRSGRVAVVLALLSLLAAACSGSGGDSAESPVATGDLVPAVSEVAPVLDFLGELAGVHSVPVSQVFDSSAGSLALADGASIEVPAGAFGEETELNVVIVDLLFEKYVENPPEGRVYLLSTEADIELGVPIVLEVPKPSDSVTVTELVDGQWRLVEVPPGPTARVQIDHFTERVFSANDTPTAAPIPKGNDPQGSMAAAALLACVRYISGEPSDFGSGTTEDDNSYELLQQLAYSVCTRALVNVLEPGGDRVELRCLGGKIGENETPDLPSAINACITEKDTDDREESPAVQPESDDGDREPTRDELNSQLAWSGEISVTGYEDRRLYEDPIVIITINRAEGTNEYRAEFLLEVAGPWGEACSQVNTYQFIGQGTASASSPPAQIVMAGRQTESYVRDDCTAQWADQAVDRTDESEEIIVLSLSNEGISGSWTAGVVTEFLLPSD